MSTFDLREVMASKDPLDHQSLGQLACTLDEICGHVAKAHNSLLDRLPREELPLVMKEHAILYDDLAPLIDTYAKLRMGIGLSAVKAQQESGKELATPQDLQSFTRPVLERIANQIGCLVPTLLMRTACLLRETAGVGRDGSAYSIVLDRESIKHDATRLSEANLVSGMGMRYATPGYEHDEDSVNLMAKYFSLSQHSVVYTVEGSSEQVRLRHGPFA